MVCNELPILSNKLYAMNYTKAYQESELVSKTKPSNTVILNKATSASA